ncbi:MAG: DNA primase [Candidatus Omnitrophota bacterium]
MPGLYAESVISDVLERCNIAELISSYIPLKRAGRNFKANCPFHAEKTASFMVSMEKQIFHCFGCGQGGNAITFVMQYEKVGFREALETVAQRCGIPLPEPEGAPGQKRQDDLKKQLLAVYEKAAAYYHDLLITSPRAQKVRNYLLSRGISRETARKFKLGFAPDEWEGLLSHLKKQNIPLSLLEKSGLAVAKDKGGLYDRFRNRIMFPITDSKGRTIAFGGRVLDDATPKYINSPETPVYTKGKNLFGFELSRDFIRQEDQAIVVEGYLDMIVPFETGVKNIVASLGTALTEDQIRLIKRYTKRVVMLYDADLAGELATMRALELLIGQDVDVRVAELPKGDDPDSFARKHGRDAFVRMVEEASPVFEYRLGRLLAKYDSRSTTGKSRIVREILPTIDHFLQATTRAEYVKKTAEALQVDERALMEDLKTAGESLKKGSSLPEAQNSSAIEHLRLTEVPITERMLVKLMLEEIHLIDRLREMVQPSDFVEEKLRKIVAFIYDFFEKGKICKPHLLMHYLGDEEAINIISELASLDIHNCPNKEKLIEDCVRRLKRDKIQHRCQELQKQIQQAQNSGEDLQGLLMEFNDLIKQRSNETASCAAKRPQDGG